MSNAFDGMREMLTTTSTPAKGAALKLEDR